MGEFMKGKLIKTLPYILGAMTGVILGINGSYVDIEGIVITGLSIIVVAII